MSNEFKIPVVVDATGVGSGVAATTAGLEQIQGCLTEAEAAAKKFGVSVDVAQAAIDKNRAAEKAVQVNALAAAMREASSASNEEAAASEVSIEAQEGQAQSAERLQEIMKQHQQGLMQNVFYIHRLAEGFKDISMGGRVAGQGLMDVSEALQYMVAPELAIYVVIAQVVGMLAVMATSHRHAGEEAKEHAKSEEGLREALDKQVESMMSLANTTANVHLEVLTNQLNSYLTAQKAILDQQDEWNTSADKRLGYIQAETKATQDLMMAQLEHQKQLDLNNATSDEQRAQIEADYKRREIMAKGGNEQEANLAEQTLLAQQKQEDDQKRAQLLQNNRDNDAKLQALKDDASDKSAKAVNAGFQPDELGSFKEQMKAQEERVKKAAEAYSEAQASGRTEPIVHTQREYYEEQSKLNIIRDADSAQEALKTDGGKLSEEIKKNSDSIDKLVARLEEIYSKENVLSTESKTDAINTDTAKLGADRDFDKAQSALHWKGWQDAIKDGQRQHESVDKGESAEIGKYKGLIEASGNKQWQEELRQILERDAGDKAKTLQDIVALFGKQDALNASIVSALRAHSTKLDSHTRAIRSLSNGGGYQ